MEGEPRFVPAQELPDFPYARYAELIGLRGIRIDAPDQIGPAWDEALAADRPTLLEMITDPDVPPLPPHVSGKQMREYLKAIAKRDPQAIDIVVASAKEWWDGLFPGKAG
jgi:pyruvate dehydrogenase (quinone)